MSTSSTRRRRCLPAPTRLLLIPAAVLLLFNQASFSTASTISAGASASDATGARLERALAALETVTIENVELRMKIDKLEKAQMDGVPVLAPSFGGFEPEISGTNRDISVSKASFRSLAESPYLDFDANVSAATGGYDCATVASYGMCDTYACPACTLAGLCDHSCNYCAANSTANDTLPTVAPSATPTNGCADDDAALVAAFGADCSTAATMGYCDTFLCPTCSYPGYCDISCSYCPTPAPTAISCTDDDATLTSTFGADCPTAAAMGYCASYLCPTCGYSGYCDDSCGYCPTPAPTIPCVDDDATLVATFGADCPTVAAMGYCGSYFCPTCGYSGLCDDSCGLCSAEAVVPSTTPTISSLPTTMPPTPNPTAEPTTASPTVSAPPTLSQAPTLSGVYDISNHNELSDAITSAEEGREWILTITSDLVTNSSIVPASNTRLKIVGSSALGRRARITPVYTGGHTFLDHGSSGTASESITLWVENLEFDGFYSVLSPGPRSSLTVENCRFSEATSSRPVGGAIYIKAHATAFVHGSEFVANKFGIVFECWGGVGDGGHLTAFVHDSKFVANRAGIDVCSPHSTVFVNDSEFADNHAEQRFGAGIIVGFENTDGNAAVVTNTVFARNSATFGAAIYAWQQNSQVTIRDCSMYDNYAYRGSGGAIHLQGQLKFGKTLTIEDSLFQNNTAMGSGGAVHVGSKVQLNISSTTFISNAAHGTGGGSLSISSEVTATIVASRFERNKATVGAGGALIMFDTTLHLIDTNLTANEAVIGGGALRCEEQSVIFPRGATRFVDNVARGNGGAISLDESEVKTNEGAIVFTGNEARLGGAVSAANGASVLISAGCRTITFEMNFASSVVTTSNYAISAVVRRIHTADTVIVPGEMMDDHGEWTILAPSHGEDTSVSFCLSPGQYEIVGSEGWYCFEGWAGGSLTVADIEGKELVTGFTVEPGAGCTAKTTLLVPEDISLTQYGGPVLFEGNRAAGTASGACGAGCGGAVYLDESCSAELDRIDFSRNSAAHGGAVFVGLQGDLSLSRSVLRDNLASSGNGGAVNAGVITTIRIKQTTVKHNVAGGDGGAFYLSGVAAATLRSIDATGNEAGTAGGAMAVFDSTYTKLTLANSTTQRNTGPSGGALFIKDSDMGVEGVQFVANLAKGDGGAVAASGTESNLALSDVECADVQVLLDWTAAGEDGCPVKSFGGQYYTCHAWSGYLDNTCSEVSSRYFQSCNGCDCNDP